MPSLSSFLGLRSPRARFRPRRLLRAVLSLALLAGLCFVPAPAALAQAVPPDTAAGPPGLAPKAELALAFGRYFPSCRPDPGIQDLAVDSAGNVVVVGFAAQDCDGGSDEPFVAKVAPDGSLLFLRGIVELTLGGHFEDVPNGVALDAAGNIYIAGGTTSSLTHRPFPVVDPFQGDNGGPLGTVDAYVMKLDPTAETILYATFLGGSGDDYASDIGLDGEGRIVVTGTTGSADFPTASPLQAGHGGGDDAFLAVLEPDGSALALSTFLGGAGDDRATRLDVLGDRIFLTGSTASADFPVELPGGSGGLSPARNDVGESTDAFVVRVDALQSLGYSGYLGGGGDDVGYGLAVSPGGVVHVAGTTGSPNFPTVNPIQDALAAWPEHDLFLTRIEPSGASFGYSTFINVEGNARCGTFQWSFIRPPYCAAVGVTTDGTAIVTGNDVIALAVAPDGSEIVDRLEGTGGTAVEINPLGRIYVGGITDEPDLPFLDAGWDSLAHDHVGWVARVELTGGPGGGAPPLPPGPFLETDALPGFRFKVRLTTGGQVFEGRQEADCLGETLCVSGALPGRSELFARIIGPRPNGFLWVNLVRFTPSRVEVWVEQTGSGALNYYDLSGLGRADTELTGLVDKQAFSP